MPRRLILGALRRCFVVAAAFLLVSAYAEVASAAPLCADLGFVNDPNLQDENDIICRDFTSSNNAAYYWFDQQTAGYSHLLRVTVDQVLEEFGLPFQLVRQPADYLIPGFPQFTCVAYADPQLGGPCIEYSALFIPLEGTHYFGDVTWLISWEQAVGTDPIPEILHEIGEGDPDDIYDEVLEGLFFSPELGPNSFACDFPYYASCPIIEFKDGDPTRAGLSDNFTKVIVAQQIPEPGTLALLGVAASGYLLSVRRRRRKD